MAVTTARRITSTPRTIRDPKVRRAWQEHAHQAGEIVTAWNDLQAGCFIIFYVVSEAKAHNSWGIALAIWHSVASDSTQREMMLGAAQESLSDKSRVLAHIKWLKNTADKLSKFRNDPAHTPISFMLTNKRGQLIASPNTLVAKEAAVARLHASPLHKTWRKIRGDLYSLAMFAESLAVVIGGRPVSLALPRRPHMQSLPASPLRKRRTRRGSAKPRRQPLP